MTLLPQSLVGGVFRRPLRVEIAAMSGVHKVGIDVGSASRGIGWGG